MLKSMRESFHQLKWILLAVVAAFIIGFVYVDMGLGGAGQRSKADDRSFAARVNGSTITYNEFQRSLANAEERYKQMYGGQFSKELEDAMGLDRQVLESLVDQRLMLQEARRLEYRTIYHEVRENRASAQEPLRIEKIIDALTFEGPRNQNHVGFVVENSDSRRYLCVPFFVQQVAARQTR